MKPEKMILRDFMQLTDHITNSRHKPLRFEGLDDVFYRGELHIIQHIGETPGIFSSELARRVSVTRAVIHKTVTNLEGRGYVKRSKDAANGKNLKLTLTVLGERVYRAHVQMFLEKQATLYKVLQTMSPEVQEGIAIFLKCADALFDS